MDKKYIIFSTDFRPYKGGVAEFVFNIANYLSKKNKLKQIITFTDPRDETFPYPVTLSNILKKKRNLGYRLGDNFFLTRKINTLIHKIFIYYSAYKDLRPFIREKNNFKILIASYYNTYDIGVFITLCRWLKIDYEILYHGLDILIISKQNFRQFKKNTINASRLIFNSSATQNLLFTTIKTSNLPTTEIIYPFIDTQTILSNKILPITELENKWKIKIANKQIISCIAALNKRKGVHIAISAFEKFAKKFPNYIFLIGGKGPEYENLKAQIKKYNLENKVFLLGLISDEEKWSILKYSKIFVLPSSGLKGKDWEGFGISYIEASLFENIVIGGKHGGIPEAVIDKKTGFLIDFEKNNSENLLYELLIDISTNDYTSMTKEGKNFVIKNFDISNFNDKF